jgi:haloacetate dehalogenase
MPDSVKGLEAFTTHRVDLGASEIFARIAGQGPPLLLLHGFPQTHVCWSRIAPKLAARFTVILADLRGHGESKGPPVEPDAANYSKRAVAGDMLAVMKQLGFPRFHLAGHDRGARVAYRLALDSPQAVERLAVLSIYPTFFAWRRLTRLETAIGVYHWYLLAQKPPIPHDLIAGAPDKFVRNTLASWTKDRTLNAFAQDELAAYETAFARPEAIAGVCGDYRAGWTTDRAIDEADLAAGRRISCPTLVTWGLAEYPDREEMLGAWREIAADIHARPIDCGHFLTEEAPEETSQALLDFLSA